MDGLDEAIGRMRVAGGYADNRERLHEIAAEAWSWELLEALKSAVAGASHWRMEAQALLRKIDNLELPKPLNEMGTR